MPTYLVEKRSLPNNPVQPSRSDLNFFLPTGATFNNSQDRCGPCPWPPRLKSLQLTLFRHPGTPRFMPKRRGRAEFQGPRKYTCDWRRKKVASSSPTQRRGVGRGLQGVPCVHSWALGVLSLGLGWVAGFPVGSSHPFAYRQNEEK